MVTGLVPGAARTIARFGTPAQQALWLPRLASGEWLATMALIENAKVKLSAADGMARTALSAAGIYGQMANAALGGMNTLVSAATA